MSNVQWCWSARKLGRTPSPDNANDILLDEITIRQQLDLEALLKYQESQAHHVAKFSSIEQEKLLASRKQFDKLLKGIDACKKPVGSNILDLLKNDSDSE